MTRRIDLLPFKANVFTNVAVFVLWAGNLERAELFQKASHYRVILGKQLDQAEKLFAGLMTQEMLDFAGINFSAFGIEAKHLVEEIRDHLTIVDHLHRNLLTIFGKAEMMTVDLCNQAAFLDTTAISSAAHWR